MFSTKSEPANSEDSHVPNVTSAAAKLGKELLERAQEKAFKSGKYRVPLKTLRNPSSISEQRRTGTDVSETDTAYGWKAGPGMPWSRTGPGRSYRDPHRVGKILKFATREWEVEFKLATVVNNWSAIVGDKVAEKCPVESFEAKTKKIIVRAVTTAWAQQFRILLPTVMRRIAEENGEGMVEIVQVLGPAAPSWKKGPLSVPGRGPRDTYG